MACALASVALMPVGLDRQAPAGSELVRYRGRALARLALASVTALVWAATSAVNVATLAWACTRSAPGAHALRLETAPERVERGLGDGFVASFRSMAWPQQTDDLALDDLVLMVRGRVEVIFGDIELLGEPDESEVARGEGVVGGLELLEHRGRPLVNVTKAG